MVTENPIRVGISSCLLGEEVRFDGGHKRDPYVMEVLGRYFHWVPACPELEVGMGVPREAVRLEGSVEDPRMIGTRSQTDWTDRMKAYSQERARQLEKLDLSGYIFKSKSPSCGLERVRIYTKGGSSKNGRGIFAAQVVASLPLLPMEEEGRLNDPKIRENFIVRVFSYYRLKSLRRDAFRISHLIDFHAKHKYLLLAHSPRHYKQMGTLVGNASTYPHDHLLAQYSSLFMQALKMHSSIRKNGNVLLHILGFIKKQLEPAEKQDILESIRDYQNGITPLVVPLTLLRHYLKKHKVKYILEQVYLDPHPKELMLRNHA